jgi:hypothetical protein
MILMKPTANGIHNMAHTRLALSIDFRPIQNTNLGDFNLNVGMGCPRS